MEMESVGGYRCCVNSIEFLVLVEVESDPSLKILPDFGLQGQGFKVARIGAYV